MWRVKAKSAKAAGKIKRIGGIGENESGIGNDGGENGALWRGSK